MTEKKTVYDVVFKRPGGPTTPCRKVLVPRVLDLPTSMLHFRDLVVDGVELRYACWMVEEFVVGPPGLEGFSISPACGFKNKDGIR